MIAYVSMQHLIQNNMNPTVLRDKAILPNYARSSLNRCNLPAVMLGGLAFQQHPTLLFIDGVYELHKQLFRALYTISDAPTRALHFSDYMRSCFLLDNKDEAGFDPEHQRVRRGKADYLRLLRGWMFNADGIEAAVLKHWVESRFGLLPRSHQGSLADYESENYHIYQMDYIRGLYNSNALESQLDLLYSYCQYELKRREEKRSHLSLFRGINQVEDHDLIEKTDNHNYILLLNNLNSFSSDRFQSDAFGDYIITTDVPVAKLLYFHDLLPGVLHGENEYLVIGGVYRVHVDW